MRYWVFQENEVLDPAFKASQITAVDNHKTMVNTLSYSSANLNDLREDGTAGCKQEPHLGWDLPDEQALLSVEG